MSAHQIAGAEPQSASRLDLLSALALDSGDGVYQQQPQSQAQHQHQHRQTLGSEASYVLPDVGRPSTTRTSELNSSVVSLDHMAMSRRRSDQEELMSGAARLGGTSYEAVHPQRQFGGLPDGAQANEKISSGGGVGGGPAFSSPPINSAGEKAGAAEDLDHFADAHGGTGKRYIAEMGSHVPITMAHLFKRPLIRQWIHNGKIFREVSERIPSRFELFFDLVFVGERRVRTRLASAIVQRRTDSLRFRILQVSCTSLPIAHRRRLPVSIWPSSPSSFTCRGLSGSTSALLSTSPARMTSSSEFTSF